MNFLSLLSLEVLLAGIPAMLLAKNKYIKLIRTIFWSIGLCSLIAPSMFVLVKAVILDGYFPFDILWQSSGFITDSLNAFFLFIISVFGILYSVYDLKYGDKNTEPQTKNCIVSTLILSAVITSLLTFNGLFYIISCFLIGLLGYHLITARHTNECSQRAGSAFIVMQYISYIFAIVPIIITSAGAGSIDFAGYIKIFDKYHQVQNFFWISFMIFYFLQLLSIFIYKKRLKSSLYENSALTIFLPVIIKLFSWGMLTRFICYLVIPSRITICSAILLFALLLTVCGIIGLYTKSPSENLPFTDLVSSIFELTVFCIAFAGIVYNIPMFVIISFIALFIIIINNILSLFISSISAEAVSRNDGKKTRFTNAAGIAGQLFYAGFPLSGSFFAGIALSISVILVLLAKSVDFAVIAAFVIIAIYAVINWISTIRNVRLINNSSESTESGFDTDKTVLAMTGLLVLISVFAGTFVSLITEFVVPPASIIISGKVYLELFNSVVKYSELIQHFILVIVSTVIAYILIKNTLIPIVKRYCLKK